MGDTTFHLTASLCKLLKLRSHRIPYTEPEFANPFRESRIDSHQAGTTSLFDLPAARLAESIAGLLKRLQIRAQLSQMTNIVQVS